MMRIFFSLVLCFVLATQATATHIVGGELTYRSLGNQQFEVTLTIYRDCFNGIPRFDSIARIGIYLSGTDSLFNKLKIPYDETTNDTLPLTSEAPCLLIPPNFCVHKATYRDTVFLPFCHEGYTLIYQSCCRNGQTRNVPDPMNTGISFIAEISAASLMLNNSAATFNRWPPVAICIHQPLQIDHSATDPDGDTIRYRLCTPLNGPDSLHSMPDPPAAPPYEELSWIDPPYSLANMLGGVPLAIDSLTGMMTAVPNTIGSFVVGVCLDEYRNQELISTTRRDFQYFVTACNAPTAAFFAPEILCDTLQVAFENRSLYAGSYQWFFDWPGDGSQTSSEIAPVHTYPDTGLFTVALVVEPNTICSDTFFAALHLVATPNLTLAADPTEIFAGLSTQLSAHLPGAVSYAWEPSESLDQPEIANPVGVPAQTTDYTVTATLDNGCSRTGTIRVTVNPPPCGEPFVFFPTGFSPNNDGQNDVLKLESTIAAEASWEIFNRWGEKVFEATSPDDTWDGTFRGQPQPAETYGFYLHVRCNDGQEFFQKGNVTLLR